MNTFSFRAECMPDISKLLMNCRLASIHVTGTYKFDNKYPDVVAEIETEATLEQLRDIIRDIEDSHVLLETLRPIPLSQNSLERDTNIR